MRVNRDRDDAGTAATSRQGTPSGLHLALLTSGVDAVSRKALADALARRIAEDTGLTVRCDEPEAPTTAPAERRPATDAPSATAAFDIPRPVVITVVAAEIGGRAEVDVHAMTAQAAPDMFRQLPGDIDHVWVVQAGSPGDGALESALLQTRLSWSRLPLGTGPDALSDAAGRALSSVSSLLRPRASAGAGLFTRLAQRDARYVGWRWACENCDDPDCEHALRAANARNPQLTALDPGG
jgi:hypothetical protein